MVAKVSRKICNNAVAINVKAIYYDNCQLWVHIKCNKMRANQTYKTTKKPSTACTVQKSYFPSQT